MIPKRRRAPLLTLIAGAGVALYLFPIYWMFISGLKSSAEIFANPPTLFPREPSLDAFHYVFVRENIAALPAQQRGDRRAGDAADRGAGSMGGYAHEPNAQSPR